MTTVRGIVLIAILAHSLVGGSTAGESPQHVRCLAYEPAVVELVGVLTSKTYPGPPGYGETPAEDRPEEVLLLNLDKPTCTTGDATSDLNNQGVTTVGTLQVNPQVPSGKQLRDLVGHRVVVKGSLFNAHTGHHRTKVLINVASIRNAV